MHVRRAAIAALLFTLLPTPAAPFEARHEHWTVLSIGTSCMAINRPSEEFNGAPYNALGVLQRRGGPARLAVYAWPGVFKPGEAAKITITISGAWTELEAEARDTYFVEAKGPIPAKLLADLREARARQPNARIAEFDVTGVSKYLFFDLSQLEAVTASLETCVNQLPRG